MLKLNPSPFALFVLPPQDSIANPPALALNETQEGDLAVLKRTFPENYLTIAAHEQLVARGEAACFSFEIQEQGDGCLFPVENPMKPWIAGREGLATWISVATFTVPPQEFTTHAQNAFCREIGFNPWHTLPEHRPMGNVNAMRKQVYQSVQIQRRTLNGVTYTEPTGDETFSGPLNVDQGIGAGNTKDYRIAAYPYPNNQVGVAALVFAVVVVGLLLVVGCCCWCG